MSYLRAHMVLRKTTAAMIAMSRSVGTNADYTHNREAA